MSNRLAIQPLTAKDFAAFGDVIETSGHTPIAINQGQSQRFDDLAELQLTEDGGSAAVSIFATKPLPLPLLLRQMECHHLGSQAFIPLSGRPWLVVVAPKGEFAPDQMRGFLATGKQGVNFHPGVWHHFSLSLGAVCEFLVIDRKSSTDDCQQIALNPPVKVIGLP